MKRDLNVGFEAVGGTEGVLRVCGSDASTPFIPDGICRVRLSGMRFHPDGLNHGKTAYLARDWEAPAASEEAKSAGEHKVSAAPPWTSPPTVSTTHLVSALQ